MYLAIMRVTVCMILSVRRHCGESRAVSCSMAVMAAIRKHPVIARIMRPCNEEILCNCAVVDAVCVSSGLSMPDYCCIVNSLCCHRCEEAP